MTQQNSFGAAATLRSGSTAYQIFRLDALEKRGFPQVARLPFSIKILLENLLRHEDGQRVTAADVEAVAAGKASAQEISFMPARVLLQDFTGVPCAVDLAAMRDALAALGADPGKANPLLPADLVIDHSVQVDQFGTPGAFDANALLEYQRNRERYSFLRWAQTAFEDFRVVPPDTGIVHQINLEYLASVVFRNAKGDAYPDTLVGTDSHTTMINGLGIVGWGDGGIEAEAAMLGQPVYLLTPDVVGVHLTGSLREGITATDLVLRVTEILRKAKVVGKFVEFHGEGAASLSVTDRATIANMSPEYGATMGYFPPDEETCVYLKATGRSDGDVDAVRNYFKAQGIFGMPQKGECDYTTLLELDLGTIVPSVAGPKRRQESIPMPELKNSFLRLLLQDSKSGGYGKTKEEMTARYAADIGAGEHALAVVVGGGQQHSLSVPAPSGNDLTPRETSVWTETEMMNNRPTPDRVAEVLAEEFPKAHVDLGHGDVLIAAITSCTNTSNPSVMLAAGLLAKKAVERGMKVRPTVKTSLAPGSRVVTEYLEKTGLQPYLNQLGFNLVGYGCTTCIGNSGPLDPTIEDIVNDHDLIAASVLSGNRNFEARVHQSIKANFLMSPPLVVAFALAGRVDLDLVSEPIGKDKNNEDVYLKDIWPSMQEISSFMRLAFDPGTYQKLYSEFAEQNPLWNEIPTSMGQVYEWDSESTYIQEPPYFEGFSSELGTWSNVQGARPLAIFGDSVTTDHISPAGAIKASSPAGIYLQQKGVSVAA